MTLLGSSKLLVCETIGFGDCGTEEREMRVGKLKLHKTHILTEIQVFLLTTYCIDCSRQTFNFQNSKSLFWIISASNFISVLKEQFEILTLPFSLMSFIFYAICPLHFNSSVKQKRLRNS